MTFKVFYSLLAIGLLNSILIAQENNISNLSLLDNQNSKIQTNHKNNNNETIVIIDRIQHSIDDLKNINTSTIKKINLLSHEDYSDRNSHNIISIKTKKKVKPSTAIITLNNQFTYHYIVSSLGDLSAYEYAVLLNKANKSAGGKTIFNDRKYSKKYDRYNPEKYWDYFNIDI
tara:strand:- start:325 stop:843 length:519 start_codon:yes stop_codon:yes gene_type:complete